MYSDNKKVFRFAPSPSGYLHIGNLRISLLNFLFASKMGGSFFLRIDDTDLCSGKDYYEEHIFRSLNYLGINFSDFYRQSEKGQWYERAFDYLKKNGLIYRCYETKEELKQKRRKYQETGNPPIYDRTALFLTEEDHHLYAQKKIQPYWRFKLTHENVFLNDLVQGRCSYNLSHLSDPVIRRADGTFTYLFSSVVCDINSQVTHILRGIDHLTNTFVQILLFKALKGFIPEFAHFALITNSKGEKLSKRENNAFVISLNNLEYDSMALNNWLFSIGRRHCSFTLKFSFEDMVKCISFESFTEKKPLKVSLCDLLSINRKFLKQVSLKYIKNRILWLIDFFDLKSLTLNISTELSIGYKEKLLQLHYILRKKNSCRSVNISDEKDFWNDFEEKFSIIQPNLDKFSDVIHYFVVLYGKILPRAAENINIVIFLFKTLPVKINQETVDTWLKALLIEFATDSRKKIFSEIRQILIGKREGPRIKDLLLIIPKEQIQERIYNTLFFNKVFLFLHNTLSRKIEAFIPFDIKRIGMYVCGPTVYNIPHVGNIRSLLIFDVIYRILRFLYGEKSIVYVRNITDIDDKIIDRALKLNISSDVLVKNSINAWQEVERKIGLLEPNQQPRVTENISEIISFIKGLEKKGLTYKNKKGLLLDTGFFSSYHSLFKLNSKNYEEKKNSSVDKRRLSDFYLWKFFKDNDHNFWDSPWGKGRPGWHIECSTLSRKYLGQQFDIHGGGVDLITPHHQNEITQSFYLDGCFPAKYWVHNGLLQVEGKKMSKSLGNFLTMKDVFMKYPIARNINVFRIALLMSHYRYPLDLSTKLFQDAEKVYLKIKFLLDFFSENTFFINYYRTFFGSNFSNVLASSNNENISLILSDRTLFDDLNFPKLFNNISNLYNDTRKEERKLISVFFHKNYSFLQKYLFSLLENYVARRVFIATFNKEKKVFIEEYENRNMTEEELLVFLKENRLNFLKTSEGSKKNILLGLGVYKKVVFSDSSFRNSFVEICRVFLYKNFYLTSFSDKLDNIFLQCQHIINSGEKSEEFLKNILTCTLPIKCQIIILLCLIRKIYREQKKYKKADLLRDKILSLGVNVNDGKTKLNIKFTSDFYDDAQKFSDKTEVRKLRDEYVKLKRES